MIIKKKTISIKIVLPLLQSDFQAVIDLIEDNIVKYDTHMEWLQKFASGEILLAKIDDQIVGAVIFAKHGKVLDIYPRELFSLDQIGCAFDEYGFILYLVVDKRYQGQGIGKKLVKRAISDMRKLGDKSIGVHCWSASPGKASERLFTSLGFEKIKTHMKPCYELSKKGGPEKFLCVVCGNPCHCDQEELILRG